MKILTLGMIAILGSACSGDKKDTVWWDHQKTLIELKNELALAQYRVSMSTPAELSPPVEAEEPSPAEMIESIRLLTEVKGRLQKDINGMNLAWDDFRSGVLEGRRSTLFGKSFNKFQTADGKTYKKMMITKIDNGGVSLRHSDGTARLRFQDLNSEEHAYFGLDEDLAAAANHAERSYQIAYEKWVAKSLAISGAKEAEESKIRQKERNDNESARFIAAASLRSSASSANASPLSSSIGKLGATSTVSTGSSRYSRRYSSYGSFYRRPTIYYYNSTPSCYQNFNHHVAPCDSFSPIFPVR